MNLSSWQKQKIIALGEYQEAMAYLYTLYSKKFPLYQQFWLELALPKIKYADWLRHCFRKITDGTYRYNMMRFTIESVLTGMDYLRELIRNARSEKFSQEEAVALAFVIESGKIASKFYEIIDSPDDELKDLIREFRRERIENFKKLRDFNSFRRISNSLEM